jgi:hypothetical protein
MLHGNIVKALHIKEARDLSLPQTKAFMTEGQVSCLDVYNKHAVDIDIDTLVANY